MQPDTLAAQKNQAAVQYAASLVHPRAKPIAVSVKILCDLPIPISDRRTRGG